jgi:exosortase A-associated hydrolase 1
VRRLISFRCAGETLIGTLDEAPAATGLLIVSGGNEIRVGAHRGMALLAERVAATGAPVFRFDRRGIGDSGGENQGYASSGPDIAAAASAFRAEQPQISRIIAFGNCDAATALVLFSSQAGIDRLILANPWVVETNDHLPPAAAIRTHYAQRLRDPKTWTRLARGNVDLVKFIKGLWKISDRKSEDDSLADNVFCRLPTEATIILAEHDATALAFADAARRHDWRGKTVTIPTASHSFAHQADADALFHAIIAAIG